MTDLDRSFDDNVYDLNVILHPGSVFDHPRDVLADTTLSRAEKRAILASWASDAAAVTSCPSLRAIPGAKRTGLSLGVGPGAAAAAAALRMGHTLQRRLRGSLGGSLQEAGGKSHRYSRR